MLSALVALQLSVAAAALPSFGTGTASTAARRADHRAGVTTTSVVPTPNGPAQAPGASPDQPAGPAALNSTGNATNGTPPTSAGPVTRTNGSTNSAGATPGDGGTTPNAGFDCPPASDQTVPTDSSLGTPGAYVAEITGGSRRMAAQAFDAGYRAGAAQVLYTIRLANGASGLCLAPATGGPARAVKAVTNLWNPSLAPDGRSIAYAQLTDGDGNSEVHVVNADGTGDRVLFGAGSNGTVTWRADGAALAACHDDQLLVAPIAGGAPAKLPAACPDGEGLAFSPTGDRLATVSTDNLDIVDVRTGAVTRAATKTHLNYEVPPSWSPDGKNLTIAFTGQDASGVLVVSASGSGAKVIANGVVQGPNWAPTGNRIVFSTVGQGVTQMVVFDPATGASTVVARVSRPLRPWLLPAAWASDGKSFTFSIIGGTGPGAG